MTTPDGQRAAHQGAAWELRGHAHRVGAPSGSQRRAPGAQAPPPSVGRSTPRCRHPIQYAHQGDGYLPHVGRGTRIVSW